MDGRRILSPIEEWRKQEGEDRKYRLAMDQLRKKHLKKGMPKNIVRPMGDHDLERI